VTDDTDYVQAIYDRGEELPPGVYHITRPVTLLGGGGGIGSGTEGAAGGPGHAVPGTGGGGASSESGGACHGISRR